MKKNYWWFIVVIVFVIGLMISNMLVQAKEITPEIQWEYKIINTKNRGEVSRQRGQDLPILNKHGLDGWELCGVRSTMYFFKRKIKK